MSFSSLRSSYFIPDFVEIQRKSFLNLLDKGLIQELNKRNPIINGPQNLELTFYPEYYKLNPPDWTPKEAILKSKTYACRLYVPIKLANKSTKEIKLQWVLLGNVPLMTKRGHFILNGSSRVIVNQMVRSPGIYYQQLVHLNKKRTYYADLISHRGAWLRLETDKKHRVWARLKKAPKISIVVFLQALGFSKEKIFQSITYPDFLKSSFLKEDHPNSSAEALKSLYFKIHQRKDKSEITAELAQTFLSRKFFNSRTYDLSKLGRLQLNKKLGLVVPLSKSTLTEQDILFATDYLIKLEYGIGTLDDIDDLKNRRVRASGELIQNQLGTGFIRLEKMIREKLKKPRKKLTVRDLITTKPINGALREFFGSSPLSQFMDQTNPLAELTHKRRLSSLGPGGISRETAGMAVRGIHPSHYGRICPIETPEGPNAGLVNSLTTYAKINSQGFLETPFYTIYKGQIQPSAGPIFFSADCEDQVTIAPGDLKLSQLDFLPNNVIPVRVTKEFKKIIRDKVEYISISPIQMISIATSLIPFLEHDDANRALMGSNMQRQAVPLMVPERPIVGTGLEGRVSSDSGHAIQSKTSGFVSYVSGEQIIIKNCTEPTFQTKSMFSKILRKTNLSENNLRVDDTQLQHETSIAEPLSCLAPVSLPSPRRALAVPVRATGNQAKLGNLTRTGGGKVTKFRLETQKATVPSLGAATGQKGNAISAKNLKRKIASLPSKLQFKKISIVKTLFNCIGRELNEINFFNEEKLSDKQFFTRQQQLIQSLMQSKQTKVFKFLVVKNVAKNQLKPTVTSPRRGKVTKRSFETRRATAREKYFSPKVTQIQNTQNWQSQHAQSLSLLKEIEKLNFLNHSYQTSLDSQKSFIASIFQRSTSPKIQKFRSQLDFDSWKNREKIIKKKADHHTVEKLTVINKKFREKSVSKKQHFSGTSNFTYYRKKTFLLKRDILKLSYNDKFNWLHFIDKKACFQSPFPTKSWKISFKLIFNEKSSWNRFCQPSKLEFSNLPPYQFKSIRELSYINYSINVMLPPVNEQNVLPVALTPCLSVSKLRLETERQGNGGTARDQGNGDTTRTSLNPRLHSSLLEIKLRLSNKVFSKFKIKPFLKERLTNKSLKSQLNDISTVASHRRGKVTKLRLETLRSTEKAITLPLGLQPSLVNLNARSTSLSNDICFPKLNKFNIEKNFSLSSLNYPLAEYQRSNQDTCVTQRPLVHEGDWVQKGDVLADGTSSVGGELALGKTILVAYMPWEGYNFEDAILVSERLISDDIYTSIHIERYEIQIRDTKFGVEQITNQIPEIEASEIAHLDTRGIAKIGSWVKEGDILVGKITPIEKKELSPHEKLLCDVIKKELPTTRDTSLRAPKNVHGRVVNIQILETENVPPEIDFEGPGRVYIYIAEKRKIQVGDKMAGRHGNKGIISRILPRQDMPYLPDGTPIDMVLNPLGVPSRMNVGQVFECLMGLAGKQLDQQFKIIPFDEIYGPEASRSLVYSKLFEARIKTGQKWLFDPNFAGKTKLFDGRNGNSFDQAVTVGQAYMLKLIHLVDEKIHARSTGPYSLVTQQPLRGRSKQGGQRLGEMEVWALEGFGAAYILQELLTVKSDDMKGRHQVVDAILKNRPISLGTPESFKVLIRELQSLCLDVKVYNVESSGHRKQIDAMELG